MEQLNIEVHQRKERTQPRVLLDDGWDTPEEQIQAENEVVYHCCEDDCTDECGGGSQDCGCENNGCDWDDGCGCTGGETGGSEGNSGGCDCDCGNETCPDGGEPAGQPKTIIFEKHKECIERSQPTGCNDETGSYRKCCVTVKIIKRY